MKCEAIRDHLSEYHDNELDQKTGDAIRAHLSTCAQCQRFYKALCLEASTVFKGAEHMAVPQYIWARIESSIDTQTTLVPRVPFIERVILTVRRMFATPKLAVSATSMFAIFITALVITAYLPKTSVFYEFAQEQSDFFNSLDTATLQNQDEGFGTAIEELL